MKLSVVVPTRDRLGALLDTLAALDAQEVGDPVELIVVDNGSTDGTPAVLRERAGRLPLTLLEEPRPGPAAARNRGIAAARAAVVLILGDDMRPASGDLLARHVALHDADPRREYAVLGRVTWRPDLPVTPFMTWLERGGPQFAFEVLTAGLVPASRHLYTSQVSLKREMIESAGGFDERFPSAAVEDIELGLRLEREGLELDYHPELLVYHDHPQDPVHFARRQERVGEAARLMREIHGDHDLLPHPRWTWSLLRAAAPVLAPLATRDLRPGARERVWEALAMAAYVRGWRRSAARRGS